MKFIFFIYKNFKNKILHFLYFRLGNFLAILHGVQLGDGAKISPKAHIKNAAYIGNATIGADAILGKGTYINSGSIDSGIIGNYCSIGYDVIIGPTEHEAKFWTTSPVLLRHTGCKLNSTTKNVPPPIIGSDVWIGAKVIILKNTIIGNGAIVAAGSVVTKNIPEYEIWGGIPARFLKNRFENNEMLKLAKNELNKWI